MKRKVSFRAAYAERQRAKGVFSSFKKAGGVRQRKGMRKQSVKRAEEMEAYHKEKAIWLARPENAVCQICRCAGINPPRAAVEVHHSRGRIHKLLRYQPFWVPSCRECRETPHQRPSWARDCGLLCEPALWNTFPTA